MQSRPRDPRLKRSNTNSDDQEVEHQHHCSGGKRRIGRDFDQQEATTSSKELDARLQVAQESFALAQASDSTVLTSELQQALATQQRRGQADEIQAHIDALTAAIISLLHNSSANHTALELANFRLRAITRLPLPTPWQATQVKQNLHSSRNSN
jgi:hypothetical protein